MGPIKVDRIISINSEEQSYKAENILNSLNPRKTWRCKPGEKQAIVILQFLETSIISSIDVGNNSSAFIEIFVGKSTSDDFQVLLVTSSLMTLHECKNGLNLNKVCFFNTSQLSTACNESWDRVKIVCTQPYIKQCSFGLSFITFHSKDIPQKKPIQQPMSGLVQLGLFSLRNDDEEDNLHAPGKLFNKHNANKTIVDNDAPIQSIISLHKNNLAKRENCSRTDKPSRINSDNSHLSSPIIKHIEPVTPSRNKATTNTKSPESSTSRNQRDEPLSKRIKFSKTTSVTQRPFDELFDKVVFSISGYENPYRSVIRSKALEMGAIYKNNWDKSCTHLVCAFMNTPKYQEVKRQGFNRIVTGSWIDICHEKRCKIPWRRFALDKSEGNKCESEDEIKEFVPSTNFNTDNTSSKKLSPSTSQSKDIIHQDCSSIDLNIYDKPTEVHENVKPPPVNTDNTSSKKLFPSTTLSKDIIHQDCSSIDLSIYDAPTDIDSDSDSISNDILADERSAPLPLLDNVFNGCLFYLSPFLIPSITKECHRYIIALDGKLCTKENCNYIVSMDDNDLKLKNAVTPQWIWDCYDKRKLLSINYQQNI